VQRVQLTDQAFPALPRDDERGLERREPPLLVNGQEIVEREPLPVVERVSESLAERDHVGASGAECRRERADARADHSRAFKDKWFPRFRPCFRSLASGQVVNRPTNRRSTR
jgi:hypothetical protein